MGTLDFLFQFDEPTSRLYHVNILSSLFLVIVVALLFKRNDRGLLQTLQRWIFNKRYWWNASTKQDYFIYVLNGILKIVILVPVFEFSFEISRWTSQILISYSPQQDTLNFPARFDYIFLFTLLAFTWDDFLRFIQHYLMHKVNFLWQFHKVHHSARILTPITLYRAHPVESLIAVLRNSLSLGISSGFFVFVFGGVMTAWTILGVNAFGFIFNLIGANLRHSHIRLGFGPLEYLVISPLQHQVHHSKNPIHYDKNFGVTLSIWDQIFGTLLHSKNVGALSFGLQERFSGSFFKMLIDPFRSNSIKK